MSSPAAPADPALDSDAAVRACGAPDCAKPPTARCVRACHLRRSRLSRLAGAVLLAACCAASAPAQARPPAAGGMRFDNTSSPSSMRWSCDRFAVVLGKAQGGILGVYDGSAPADAPAVFSAPCVWDATANGYNTCGGNSPYPHFAAAFDAASGNLSLEWQPGAALPYAPAVRVVLSPAGAAAAAAFDVAFTLLAPQAVNPPAPGGGAGAGYTSLSLLGVLIPQPAIAALTLPVLPGVALLPPFFARPDAPPYVGFTYPGQGGFAYFFHWRFVGGGSVALMDLSGPSAIIPSYWGLAPTAAGNASAPWTLSSGMPVNLTSGCDVQAYRVGCAGAGGDSSRGSSPCALGVSGVVVRRVLLGEPDSLAAVAQYGAFNGIDAYPQLRDKLALAPLQRLLLAPLFKFDSRVVGLPFAEYAAAVLPFLPPPPVLLHFVAFEAIAFDRFFPDFLPPAAELNSTSCDLAAAMALANAQGHATMVYSNPTWWDPQSPTLVNQTLVEWAALNASLLPEYETYPDSPPTTGIAVSLCSGRVMARTQRMLAQLSSAAAAPGGASAAPGAACNESSVRLPSTALFEDQVGARFPKLDYAPSNRGMGAAGYAAALRELAMNASAAGVGLHTEQGVDRLAAAALGFHGSVLGAAAGAGGGAAAAWWGPATSAWQPVPLAGALLRTQTVHYQHNLDGGAMARDVANLCWSLALGIHLSLDVSQWSALRRGNVSAALWMDAVAALQGAVAARFATHAAAAFTLADAAATAPASVTFFAAAGSPVFTPATPPPPYVAGAVGSSGATSSTYRTLRGADAAGAALNVSADVIAAAGAAPQARAFRLAAGGCLVAGAAPAPVATDVVAGVFDGEYNGVALAPGSAAGGGGGVDGNGSASGAHVIIEDRTCLLTLPGAPAVPAVCLLHPWGADTSIAVYAPAPAAGGGGGDDFRIAIFSRAGALVARDVGPLQLLVPAVPPQPALLAVPWARATYSGGAFDYTRLIVIYAAAAESSR